MILRTIPPQSGRTFSLKIQGRRKPKWYWVFATAISFIVAIVVFQIEIPPPKGLDLSSPRGELFRAALMARTFGVAGFSLLVVLGLSTIAIGSREYSISIEGENSGALYIKGVSSLAKKSKFDPKAGPYRIAVIRLSLIHI